VNEVLGLMPSFAVRVSSVSFQYLDFVIFQSTLSKSSRRSKKSV
jgi:hypothetical protein